MDFYKIAERSNVRGRSHEVSSIDIYPDFVVKRTRDLMIRAHSFYAIWDSEAGLWSTDAFDVGRLVDRELYDYRDSLLKNCKTDVSIRVLDLSSFSKKMWIEFEKYCRSMPDNAHDLDCSLTFLNSEVKQNDYVSKRLPYSLEKGDYSAWDTLVGTLYEKKEREKIEWSIGSIVCGDSRKIQKFCVFFGEAGTGKSTIINVIQKLFDGYYVTFDAKALASSGNQFATEMFRGNPLVAIQHDGDLSRIEDNTKLNSIVSHEMMTINEKNKPQYMARANCFLFMGTNKPVKITDAKSGIIRRLIDIRPSGKKFPPKKYQSLMNQIEFELGAIAEHCLLVYRERGKHYYDAYRPRDMMLQTDVFYNFVHDQIDVFMKQEGISLKQAYLMYKEYCDDALVDFKLPKYKFREELRDYFGKFEEMARIDGKQVRNWYSDFLAEKFAPNLKPDPEPEAPGWLSLDKTESLLDEMLQDCPAQLATRNGTPTTKWDQVTTTLKEIDTRKLHYVKVPEHHVVIDFDIQEDGKKSFEKNYAEASKWPPTYAELSKSGEGIHLHYLYKGDVSKLCRIFSEAVEVKVFTGNSSLRRRLTKCNDVPVAVISSGLPLKGGKMISHESVKSEGALRNLIIRNLRKEIHPGTKPSCDFIAKILEDAYSSGMRYDVSDMREDVLLFAMNSTHQSDYCMKLVPKMKWRSEDLEEHEVADKPEKSKGPLVFFDCEVFPPDEDDSHGLLVCYKVEGEGRSCVALWDPSPEQVLELFSMRLVGFNCRKYDNHILYARAQGYSLMEIYRLSMAIVGGGRDVFFRDAYDISETDVFDYCSKKQGLKKWEIELRIPHRELGLRWDQPVPKDMVDKVVEYCKMDVEATEATHHARHADFIAREMLAAITGMTVNDTTNTLTTRMIFGSNRRPQTEFNYRFLGDVRDGETYKLCDIPGVDPNFTLFDDLGRPLFPGYRFEHGKSTYRGEEVGEGGYVYAEPGVWCNVALLDIASMHPSSIVAENLFGDRYTAIFKELLDARIAIKHKDFDKARKMLGGKLTPYLEDESAAKGLAQALKIAINSVYGLTSAKFDNPFRDIRNVDNIVAKRGALFMINLKHEVQARGFTVAHIKTDSIKIPNATPEIIQFVMDYGKLYGYTFEHEDTYDRMCLVNDAVYIARYREPHDGQWWTATGTQFQRPYVFKTLFSKEVLDFYDTCETNSVTTAMYLDFNEDLPDVSNAEKELAKLNKDGVTSTELEDLIAKGHKYVFVGRVGLFTPVKPGCGGGLLMREKEGKYYAVGGTKGYRWKEAELVRAQGLEDQVDLGYYRKLASEAIEAIEQYESFERFTEDRSHNEAYMPPCGDGKFHTCLDCPKCDGTNCSIGYDLTKVIYQKGE